MLFHNAKAIGEQPLRGFRGAQKARVANREQRKVTEKN